MKIRDRKPPVSGVTPQQGPSKIEEVVTPKTDFAGKVGQVTASSVSGAEAVQDVYHMLAERIERGELSAEEAIEMVVDQVLDEHFSEAQHAALRESTRKVVADALENDPYLSSLVTKIKK